MVCFGFGNITIQHPKPNYIDRLQSTMLMLCQIIWKLRLFQLSVDPEKSRYDFRFLTAGPKRMCPKSRSTPYLRLATKHTLKLREPGRFMYSSPSNKAGKVFNDITRFVKLCCITQDSIRSNNDDCAIAIRHGIGSMSRAF